MKRKKRLAKKPIKAIGPPDFLADGPARLRMCLWAIALTFGYGFVNDVFLDRPEYRVSMEAIGLCIVAFTLQVIRFYKRPTRTEASRQVAERLWYGFCLWQQKTGRTVAVFSLALALMATPISKLEPTVAAASLRKSDIGLVPGMDSDLQGTDPVYRFNQASSRIEKAIQDRVPGNPEKVSETKAALERVVENVRLPENVAAAAKLELAYLQSYETISRIGAGSPEFLHQAGRGFIPGIPGAIGQGVDKTTFIATPELTHFTDVGPNPEFFSGFTVMAFGHNPGRPIPQFAISKSEDTQVVFNDIKVVGMAQDVGSLTWTNVTFQGCLIRYHGQPVRMGNVHFLNCTFERSPDGKGQQLLDYLSTHQGEPVNAYVP
jgi:hypothetical protein